MKKPKNNQDDPDQPVPPDAPEDSIFGFLKDKGKITGDIESPANDLEDWDMLRD